ncbi:hypothetical protein [Sutcliffiella horikoshii]|uniref:hypothetical protein n=1 Tax=Sutcliffiella horikoshii TaxID=79883 RepID=UPI001F456A36|nr:hypothetical protein [Sutcliffiella horikoshii]MCG1020526.1 hypothetical protein [Sutcliffiella horikoshii]
MMWFTLILIASMIIMYVYDHFYGKKSTDKNHGLPIKGMLVTGILYYLVSKGLLSKEEEKLLEDKSIEEIESYVFKMGVMTELEWSEICLNLCEAQQDGGFDFDSLA